MYRSSVGAVTRTSKRSQTFHGEAAAGRSQGVGNLWNEYMDKKFQGTKRRTETDMKTCLDLLTSEGMETASKLKSTRQGVLCGCYAAGEDVGGGEGQAYLCRARLW